MCFWYVLYGSQYAKDSRSLDVNRGGKNPRRSFKLSGLKLHALPLKAESHNGVNQLEVYIHQVQA